MLFLLWNVRNRRDVLFIVSSLPVWDAQQNCTIFNCHVWEWTTCRHRARSNHRLTPRAWGRSGRVRAGRPRWCPRGKAARGVRDSLHACFRDVCFAPWSTRACGTGLVPRAPFYSPLSVCVLSTAPPERLLFPWCFSVQLPRSVLLALHCPLRPPSSFPSPFDFLPSFPWCETDVCRSSCQGYVKVCGWGTSLFQVPLPGFPPLCCPPDRSALRGEKSDGPGFSLAT